MLRDELYLEFYPKYAPKFERHGLSFAKHFNDKFDSSHADGDSTLKQVIERGLNEILQAYIDSKPTTKAGRFGRIGARIGKFFLPLIKIFKK